MRKRFTFDWGAMRDTWIILYGQTRGCGEQASTTLSREIISINPCVVCGNLEPALPAPSQAIQELLCMQLDTGNVYSVKLHMKRLWVCGLWSITWTCSSKDMLSYSFCTLYLFSPKLGTYLQQTSSFPQDIFTEQPGHLVRLP